jgi:bifunctional non-homologous end joining protein LigD
MPLVVVANSPSKEAALAGLERWKARHPEAAALLAVDDVLVDSMRGRSSTWTRIRVNLRHVPVEARPPAETPDPDDDPTRAWRERMKAAHAGEGDAAHAREGDAAHASEGDGSDGETSG